MNTLITITEKYLEYCKSQKRLDYKTIKAYRIDLKQFTSFCNNTDIHTLSAADIEKLHRIFTSKFQTQNSKKEISLVKSLFSLFRIQKYYRDKPFQ